MKVSSVKMSVECIECYIATNLQLFSESSTSTMSALVKTYKDLHMFAWTYSCVCVYMRASASGWACTRLCICANEHVHAQARGICACGHVRICVCMSACKHACLQVGMHTCECACAWMNVQVCAYVQVWACVRLYMRSMSCPNVHMHACMCACVTAHARMYACMYTNVWMCMCIHLSESSCACILRWVQDNSVINRTQ